MKKLRLILTIIECVFLLLLSAWQIAAQDKCDHDTDSLDRFDALRVRPVRVSFFDGRVAETIARDSRRIAVKTLYADDKTVLPKGFQKIYKSRWWFVCYCEIDGHIYFFEEITSGQKLKAK